MGRQGGGHLPQASPLGTYLQVSEPLRQQIESAEADVLPSEAALTSAHGVSRNAVRRALKVLEAESVVQSARGSGWRVVREGGDRRSLAERMTDLIVEGLLFVGDPYPFEAKLCERFGASRTAVRRVLAQMEGNGLLATVHGKGANRARSPDAHRPAVVLAGLMWGAPPLLQLYRDQREPTTKSGTQ